MRITNQILRAAGYCTMLSGLFLFTACSGSATADAGNSIMDKTKDMAGDMKDGASKMAGDMKDMSTDAMDKMKDGAADAKDAMADGANKMADGAKKMAGDMKDGADKMGSKMKDGADKMGSKMKEGADKMGSKMKEGASSGMSKAKSMANDTKDAVAMQTKQAADKGKAMAKSTTSSIQSSTSQPTARMEKKIDKMEEKKEEMMEKKNEMMDKKPAPMGVSHEPFDQLLKAHVSSTGVVDYAGMKSDMAKLNSYISDLSANPAQSSWGKDKQLAYWINAYNANTIKLILDNYPVSSIKDINGGKPWDKTWIKIGDKTYSLNNIENDIIRPTFKEPRIHFAVNCAAKSCPPLHNRAFTAENLNSTLEATAKNFINDSNYNQISSSSAKISSIFDWYGVDFGDVKAYLNKYSNTKIGSGANISYSDYNWSLNGK